MTSTIPQQNDNIYQNKDLPLSEKTEHNQQAGLITPPMSPINTSLSSSRPGTTRNSLKITAGQTGLPWLARDADGDNYSPIQQQSSPEELSARSPTTSGHSSMINAPTPSSPPPKFLAHPRTTSIIRFPTRKRTMQKHIYSMKDGLDPVKVLCKRLQSWQVSVKYLISMFHSIKKVESNTGKGYRKIDSNFAIPTKIENQFKSSNGVKDAWAAFRQYTRENSLIHQDFVDFIENEIAPTLNIMIKDIHHYMDRMKQNKELRTTTLWDCRKKADSVITRLNSDIYATVNSQEKAKSPYVIPKRDSLLTKYLVISTIQDLYKQENRLHKEFLETQDNYRQFEQDKIINVYTELFQTFEHYRIQHHLETLEGVTKVATLFSAIETDSEWLDFLHHHENDLVKQTAAFKDEQALDFPNVSHPLVQPLIMGNLQRHHGKKWTEEYYVLSPVGLLHRFKSEKDFYQTPLKPDVTMFVPQCTLLINPTSYLLELRGKTLNGLFGSKKLVELSSAQPDIIKQWIDILGPVAIQRETAVINTPVPATAVDNRSIHSKVLAEEDDHQPETSTSGDNAAAVGAAATGAAGITEVTNAAEAEQQQTETSMKPIVEEQQQQQIVPITNTASNLAETTTTTTTDDDDDDDYRRQTIEYSTHTPISETAPAAVTDDSHNPFVSTATTGVQHASPTAAIANNTITANDGTTTGAVPVKSLAGPTREGSDLFWDTTATTTLDK